MSNAPKKHQPTTGDDSAGRVEIDDRGRNVWHWNDEQLDSTTIMLSRLENDALELEPTRSVPIPDAEGQRRTGRGASGDEPGIEATFNVKTRGGFDPYNRS